MPHRLYKPALLAHLISGALVWMAVPCVNGGNLNSLTNLVSFSGAKGTYPRAGLIQGADGSFYGTTLKGGTNGLPTGYGTVFKLSSSGTFTPLVSFARNDGAFPYAGVVQGVDGALYGTTTEGGTNGGWGTVFRVTTNGTFSSIFSFGDTNGFNPCGALLQGADGNLYGTTYGAIPPSGPSDLGTVFRMNTNGTALTTLVTFTGTNGLYPGANPFAGLIQGADGSLYGTTVSGGSGGVGSGGWGTVFKMTTNGVFTSLFSFSGTNGASPYGGLLQDSNGVLYGTTAYGGTGFESNSVQSGFGTVFQISTNGAFQTIYSFTGGNDGANCNAGLVYGKDRNLYGTSAAAGVNGCGTAFQILTNGTLTTLYTFNFDDNGAFPYGALLPGPYGSFYGTTFSAGPQNRGTVFQLSPAAPLLQLSSPVNGTFGFSWNTLPGQTYQVQYRTNLSQIDWINAGSAFVATNSTVTLSDPMNANPGRYYRVVLSVQP